MSLGLGASLSKPRLVTPGIVSSSLILKHKYESASVVPISDGAAYFDGTNDYVELSGAFNYNVHSISAWVKPTAIVGGSSIFDYRDANNDGIYLYLADGDVNYQINNTDGHYNSVLTLNQWWHIVATNDGSTSTIYVNGVSVETADTSGETINIAGTYQPRIGARSHTSPDNYFNGNISEVAIYISALTINQVKTIYNGREPYNHKEGVASGNLKSWYRMGDGAFDDYAIVTDETNATKSSELSPNVTFDTNTTGWSSYSSGDANTLSRDTTIKRTGSGSLKVVFGASNGGWAVQNSSNIVGVSANKLLVIEGYVYIPSGSYNGGHPFFTDGSSFGSASTEGVIYASSSITDQWQFMRTVSTLTSDTSGRFYVYTTGTDPSENDIIYLDDIKIYHINGNAGTMVNMSAIDIEGDTP